MFLQAATPPTPAKHITTLQRMAAIQKPAASENGLSRYYSLKELFVGNLNY